MSEIEGVLEWAVRLRIWMYAPDSPVDRCAAGMGRALGQRHLFEAADLLISKA
ncbi:MAG TPA: hypothetical protein VMU99_04265 [Acidimicrobiales bacterium]|nr:hypothetical protein [Acidimicrobiales bacterium]